jgi:hypothetical protein
VPLVAGHQVVGAGRVGAFQEQVVAGVLTHMEVARRADEVRMTRDKVDKLTLQALADLKERLNNNNSQLIGFLS